MDSWNLDEWEWNDGQSPDRLYEWTEKLAHQFFLSDDDYLPDEEDDYWLGYLEAGDWWPLMNQLAEMVDVEAIIDLANTLEPLLHFPGLPTELLEAPLEFLASVLEGNLPQESSERVSNQQLVEIALAVTHLALELPDTAQAAVQAWADVHRNALRLSDKGHDEDLTDFWLPSDLPPAVTGFSMVLLMTMMRWPKRAEGTPLPPGFLNPEMYGEILAQWQALPDSLVTTEEGASEAEALFAQGQLAHMLSQMSAIEAPPLDELEEQDVAMAYSRLSRAILWVHNRCRHCPKRDGLACQAATQQPGHPVVLLDVASEIANTGRIEGCVRG